MLIVLARSPGVNQARGRRVAMVFAGRAQDRFGPRIVATIGVFGSMAAGTIVDRTGTYGIAYAIAAALCVLAASLTFATHPPAPMAEPVRLARRRRHAA